MRASSRSSRGESESPLQGLISGSLDLDKIEYLKRDAFMCGVPYGEIDVDRLLNSLTVVEDPDSGAPAIGLVEKGLSALESLLFAKYQMYRNVYWHHAVRSATAMYKRLVDDALRAGAIVEPSWPASPMRDCCIGSMSAPRRRSSTGSGIADSTSAPSSAPPPSSPRTRARGSPTIASASSRRKTRSRASSDLAPGAVLLDYPEKPQCSDSIFPCACAAVR